MLEIDFVEAERFLTLLADGEPVTFQTFLDSKSKEGEKETVNYRKPGWHGTGTLDELKGKLVAANLQGHGVYVMVNRGDGGGREKANVVAVRALFIDLDGAPLEPVLGALIEPHAAVESSPGKFQVFYLVSDCPLERFEPLIAALARKFGGDASVADLSRVMRVPGFYHNKQEPFRSRLVHLESFQPYGVDELVKGLGVHELEAEEKLRADGPLTDLKSIPLHSIPEGERHAFLMRRAVKYAAANHPEEDVLIYTMGLNHTLCSSPKGLDEVRRITEAAIGYTGPRVNFSKLLERIDDEHEEPTPLPDSCMPIALALPVSLVTSAPGSVGLVAEWVAASVSRYQPHFAIAAALSFIGALKGHRVQSERRNRTNHMCVAIGKSGSGKSEAGNRIEDIIRCAGLDSISCGIPASDSAVRTTLARHHGRMFMYWDEMGLALENMLNRNAQHHTKAVKDILIEVSTKAYTILRKKELAGEGSPGSVKHEDVDQPCLGLYGTAQPDIFYGALSSAHASDGFYPRLLVFETADNYPEERELIYQPPPEELLDVCRQIESWPTNVSPRGNLDAVNRIEPQVLKYAPDAKRVFDTVKKDVERKLISASEAAGGIWARAMWHIEKIALTVEDGNFISRESVEWATELVLHLAPAMAAAFSMRVSDSLAEKMKKRVLGIIAKGGEAGVTQSVLTINSQWLQNGREREAILKELTEAGQIECIELPARGAGRPGKRWRVRGISSNSFKITSMADSPKKLDS